MAPTIAAVGRPVTGASLPPSRPASAAVPHRGAVGAGLFSAPAGAVVELLTSTPFMGFGFVRYAQASSDAPLVLQPGVKTPLMMTIDPTQTIAAARSPFEQTAFWSGSTLRTPNVNDLLDLRIGVSATAMIAGGKLSLEADLVSSGATLATAAADLPDQAGTAERVTFPEMQIYAGAAFQASGVQFLITASVPCTIQGATIVVAPQSSGP